MKRGTLLVTLLCFSWGCVTDGRPNAGGARSLQRQADAIEAVELVGRDSQQRLYTLDAGEVRAFRSALVRSTVSSGLYAVPPPWPVVLVAQTTRGTRFIVHPVDAVLRVNEGDPWSARVADADGNRAADVVDLWLDSADWEWLTDLLTSKLGPPDERGTQPLPVLAPDGG